MLADKELLEQFNKHREKSNRGLSFWRSEYERDQAFYAGNQMHYETGITDAQRKRMVVFNKVRPFVRSVLGTMIQTRRKPDYRAMLQDSAEQQARSEYTNAMSTYVRKNANADQVETEQDRDLLIGGVGIVDTNIEYIFNPDGEALMERVHPLDCGWDTNARKANLLDANYVWRKKKFVTEEAEALFNADAEDFDSTVPEDTRKVYNPTGGAYTATQVGTDQEDDEDTVDVYYYQWRERQKYYRVENPIYTQNSPQVVQALQMAFQRLQVMEAEQEGYDEHDLEDIFAFKPTDKYLICTPRLNREIKKVCKKLGEFFGVDIEVESVDYDKYCYYTAICSETKIFDKFKSHDQQGFTLKFKTGDWDDYNKCWFGMVRSMRMPAQYANKAFTEMLYVIASNAKGGVLYETSAIPNIKKFERDYLRNDAAVEVENGALTNGRIQPKAQAVLPNGYESILQESNAAFPAVTGINLEMLGMSNTGEVSGVLERQRIKQVMAALAPEFDAITLYAIEHGRLMLTYFRILAENAPGRTIQIIGEEGAERYESMLKEKMADEYQIDIGEAPESPTERQEKAALMMNFADRTAAVGINIYDIAAKYQPIKQSDIQAIIERMAPKPPPPPDPMAVEREQLINANMKVELEEKRENAMNKRTGSVLNQARAGYEVAKTKKEGVDTISAVHQLGANTLTTMQQLGTNELNNPPGGNQ